MGVHFDPAIPFPNIQPIKMVVYVYKNVYTDIHCNITYNSEK